MSLIKRYKVLQQGLQGCQGRYKVYRDVTRSTDPYPNPKGRYKVYSDVMQTYHKVIFLSIFVLIYLEPMVWDFSWYVSDTNLVLVYFPD